jgi:hypothetical protein
MLRSLDEHHGACGCCLQMASLHSPIHPSPSPPTGPTVVRACRAAAAAAAAPPLVVRLGAPCALCQPLRRLHLGRARRARRRAQAAAAGRRRRRRRPDLLLEQHGAFKVGRHNVALQRLGCATEGSRAAASACGFRSGQVTRQLQQTEGRESCGWYPAPPSERCRRPPPSNSTHLLLLDGEGHEAELALPHRQQRLDGGQHEAPHVVAAQQVLQGLGRGLGGGRAGRGEGRSACRRVKWGMPWDHSKGHSSTAAKQSCLPAAGSPTAAACSGRRACSPAASLRVQWRAAGQWFAVRASRHACLPRSMRLLCLTLLPGTCPPRRSSPTNGTSASRVPNTLDGARQQGRCYARTTWGQFYAAAGLRGCVGLTPAPASHLNVATDTMVVFCRSAAHRKPPGGGQSQVIKHLKAQRSSRQAVSRRPAPAPTAPPSPTQPGVAHSLKSNCSASSSSSLPPPPAASSDGDS